MKRLILSTYAECEAVVIGHDSREELATIKERALYLCHALNVGGIDLEGALVGIRAALLGDSHDGLRNGTEATPARRA